jgi:NADH-quinone oxidoreductase subunit L
VPFAGFWSKDAVLGAVLATAQTATSPVWWILYGVGILTAVLTGFYIFRLIFTVFSGEYRGDAGAVSASGVHEAPMVMLVPMAVLALLATFGGFYGLPFATNAIGTFLAPILGTSPSLTGGIFWLNLLMGLAAAFFGIGIAWARYSGQKGAQRVVVTARRSLVVRAAANGFYLDNLFHLLLVMPTVLFADALRVLAEDALFDGGSRGIGRAVSATSRGLRRLQTGYVRNYALAILVGAALILFFYLFRPMMGH